MTVVKISEVGSGDGALQVYERGDIPTYGDFIVIEDVEYRVQEVRRFTTPKRADAVRVDVARTGEISADKALNYPRER